MPQTDIEVTHNMESNRFEAHHNGRTAELTYRMSGNTIIFIHTGVPPALEGQGVGSLLVKTGLEYARKNNLKVRTLCWFVDGYVQRHAEYQELVK